MHPRVAGGHLIQTGGDLSLGQKAVANQLAAAVGSELLMRSNPLGDLLLNGLGKHPLGSLAEKARKNIVGRDWQAESGGVNFLHGGVLLEKKVASQTPFSPSTPPLSIILRPQDSVISLHDRLQKSWPN